MRNFEHNHHTPKDPEADRIKKLSLSRYILELRLKNSIEQAQKQDTES